MENIIQDNKTLTGRFTSVIDELTTLLSSFTTEQFNSIPFEGSWTTGQVATHLLKSYSGAPAFLQGPVKETKRDPAQHVGPLHQLFTDHTRKIKAPAFLLPEEKTYNKAELINSIKAISGQIAEAVRDSDLSETCMGFALPTIGEMTRLEWIHFIILHTERHIHQLKNIKAQQEK
jgi:hypothetical protein